jgi:CubicO group peptidase (beta-lactamase class C family)
MQNLFVFCCLSMLGTACTFQTKTLPTHRPLVKNMPPENAEVLRKAYDFLQHNTEFDAFIALKNDSIIADWGRTDLPIMTHSARKSIMSVLYGIAIDKGLLNLDQSLAELNIDDQKAPLSAIEKTCTIRDLLTSRSGIYIEASGETQEMKNGRPRRGAHRPGEFFYYNNWGFNVLGTIFEQQTQLSIGQAMEEWLAKPLGMKHFRAKFVRYKSVAYSEHRQYIIYLSATDLARIGMMMANGGKWKGPQIVSENWVKLSTQAYSKDPGGNEPCDGYAYLWWTDSRHHTYWATGWGGQFMLIDPKNRLVLVSRNDTGRSFLAKGLFMWRGKQALRKHHQYMYEMLKTSEKFL